MTSRRSSHRQKTREERKAYWANTIKGVTPTFDTLRPSDESTASLLPSEAEPMGSLTPTQRQSWLTRQLRQEPIRVLLVPVLLMLLGWFTYQVFSLNREMGQVSAEMNGVRKSYEGFLRELERVEVRLHTENEANAERIRHLETRFDARLEVRPPIPQRK